jgi:uncharacterized membrane protein YfcA
MFGVSLVLLCLSAFLGGLVDAIAGGGGLFTLPALLALGLPPGVAIATNKGQATAGALASFATFFRRGEIDRERVGVGFALGLVGSLLGACALVAMRPEHLRPLIVVLLLFALAVILFRGRIVRRTTRFAHPQAVLAAVSLTLGAYDGFFGPGTGSLLIAAFVMLFGDSPLRASGNAKVVNLASNIAAFGFFVFRGAIIWKLALPMALCNVIGARLGAGLALRRGDALVRLLATLVVVAVVAKLTVDSLR